MADREINIPMGPDRTGAINLPEVVPGSEADGVGNPADQTIAQPPISTADLRGLDVQGAPVDVNPVDAWLSSPMDAVPSVEPISASSGAQAEEVPAPSPEPVVGENLPQTEVVGDAHEGEEVAPEGEPEPKPVTDVAASLGALKDSIGQGRELKAREKDREDLAEKIRIDREELADRDDILANYQSIVAEQDRIVVQSTQQRDACKAELAQVVAQTDETTETLNRMRDYNDVQLQPYETALGRAQAAADQAKNDERSRKSELSAAETEVKRAEDGDAATTARARLDVVKVAYEEAVTRSNSAKEALDEAQKAYDSIREQVDQAEAPLERALGDLADRTEELKENIARLGDTISAASKRRQYCDSVYQYPAETEKLRQVVETDEAALDRMDRENDELRGMLAQSKAKSTKAKVFIGFIIVLIIVLICLFWYLSSR